MAQIGHKSSVVADLSIAVSDSIVISESKTLTVVTDDIDIIPDSQNTTGVEIV